MLYTATVYIGYMDCQASSNPIQFSPHQLQSYQPLIRFICSWRLYNQTVFSCKRKIRITKVFLFCFVNSIVEVFSKIFALDLSGYRTTGNRPTSRMSPRSYREKAVEPCTMAWITASTSSKKRSNAAVDGGGVASHYRWRDSFSQVGLPSWISKN